jgi:Uri superfamily endonuclease
MGTYCLIIQLDQDSKIKIGKLGETDFKKGYYVYVGSALNSLETRIKRHLRDEKKLHWHVDYLLAHENSKIKEVVFVRSPHKWECDVAGQISKKSEKIKGFGSSDCKCPSHLFYFNDVEDSEKTCFNSFLGFKLNPMCLAELNGDKVNSNS